MNMPSPHGLAFVIISRVDAYHAGDTVTQSSTTGFLMYANIVSVYWMLKKKNTCESSHFGNELVSIKQFLNEFVGYDTNYV